FHYLEFHKKHWPGGLRFWRITDSKGDFGTKRLYEPATALDRVSSQAKHFVELVQETLGREVVDGNVVVCSPYDAELFGHWWFEGPPWLGEVAREMAEKRVPVMTLGEVLDTMPPRPTLTLPEGSWGAGGDRRA